MLFFDDNNNSHLTLSEANYLVKEAVETSLPAPIWVQAELLEVRESRGHCYMELIEKSENSNIPIAEARACCWKSTWLRLQKKLYNEELELHAGLKVLVLVKANFHEAYGFSWTVQDIDPTFTIGDMARRKQEILRKLKEQGVIDLQKGLQISPFCKRIAVISSHTAAGYGDFCNQLAENEYGFAFETRLFPAIMQGEQIEASIIEALNMIADDMDNYDIVVIIRGGGSTADLSGFDTLALAENIANFPLPIITGIGHERDESVLDLIACISVKTPTAAAAFLIDNLVTTLSHINTVAQRIERTIQQRLERDKLRLAHAESAILSGFSIFFMKHQHRLQMLEQHVNAIDPINILRRGYSIALHNGVAIRNPQDIKSGDQITIVVEKGIIDTTAQ